MYNIFNVSDWYWIVRTNQQQVWSSARLSYVSAANDTAYQSWRNAGGVASVIGSEIELVGVMLTNWFPVASQTPLAVTCSSDDSLSGAYAIDPDSIANMASVATGIAAGKPLPSGGATFIYRDAAGNPHTFSAASFVSFASAVEAYVYNLHEAIVSLVTQQPATLPAQPVVFAV